MTGSHPRILLVEDNPGDARYIQEMLREAVSFEGRAFDGGRAQSDANASGPADTLVHEKRLEAGLERLDELAVDVVLLDLDLPDSNGLDTLTTLLDHDDTVPVVVLTGLRDRDVGTEALRRGAEEFLVKDEINPGLLVRSLHHAIERREHRLEQKRYETLIEESTDVNAILDTDGAFQYVTPSASRVLGYDSESLEAEAAFEYVHPEDRPAVREEFEALLADQDYRATIDFRFEHADGSWVTLNALGRNLLDEPAIEGVVVYTRDVTEQREYERRLEAQRERLAALNQLNSVVHGVTEAVIDQSRREEIEQIACERLAASDSYELAWVGEPDPETQSVEVRAEAGAADYLDRVSLSVDPADPRSEGPTGTALRTGEMQTARDVGSYSNYEPWRDVADEFGFQSSAAVPIRYEENTYGVLNVYADRQDAFREEERTVVEHLGRLIGHAIAAAERKQALMSDTVVELELRVTGISEQFGGMAMPGEPMRFNRTIPVDGDNFLIYGTLPADELPVLEDMVAAVPFWESLYVVGEQVDDVRFELRVSSPPLMTEVASLGGAVQDVVLDGDDLKLTVHLPQDVEVREVVETVREYYDSTKVVARRQVTDRDSRSERLGEVWANELTDRQRTVVETAFYAGFFEWPRVSSGEEVADSLGIAGPTFSQHLRASERKVFARLVGEDPEDTEFSD